MAGPRTPAAIRGAADGLVLETRIDGTPALLMLDTESRRTVPLLPAGMVAKDPAPSPDGRQIAFVSRRGDGKDDIYVVDRDGTNLRQLTTHPARDDQPAWSPDGRRIAFRSFRAGRLGDIWVMDADGRNATNLTADPPTLVIGERDPAWSPEGSRIAYSSGPRPCTRTEEEVDDDWGLARTCAGWGIWTMAANGSEQRRLTSGVSLGGPTLYEGMPAWSPDGGTIVFTMSALGGQNLVFVSAAGGEILELNLPGGQGMAAWTPDGAHVVYVHQDAPGKGSALFLSRAGATAVPQVVVQSAADDGLLNPAFVRRR